MFCCPTGCLSLFCPDYVKEQLLKPHWLPLLVLSLLCRGEVANAVGRRELKPHSLPLILSSLLCQGEVAKLVGCRELKPKHLICLGGFRNERKDIKYEGLKMELDATTYEWGTCYEIEIETVSTSAVIHA